VIRKGTGFKKNVMKNKKGRKILIVLSMILLITIGFLALIFLYQEKIAISLAKSETTEADILLFEGWLPEFAVEIAKKEFNNNHYKLIVTTGLPSRDLDFCMVAMNGYLIFYPELGSSPDTNSRHHLIEILAHSKMSGKYCSHFNFFINDSLIADFTADEKERKYAVNWTGSLKDIDSLMVQFDNDFVDDGGDRNLYVKEIMIDNSMIIQYQFNSVYDIGPLDGKNKIINDYNSHAEVARNNLITIGIDSSSVIAVKGKRAEFNRTLLSALAFRKWLKSYDGRVDGINIITLGIHSRRTWITYRSLLDKSLKIGIISLPESGEPGFEKLYFHDILGETLSLIYYRIILIPFMIF
jgi:hypothetical protein